MALQHIIAHKLERGSASSDSNLALREETWPLNDASDFCFKELKQNALRRSAKDYGCLESQHPYKLLVDQLHEDTIDFLDFSKKSVNELKKHLDTSEAIVNHHIVLAIESLEQGRVLHCYFLEQSQAYYIDSQLDIEQSLTLDTSIKFGVKINLSELYDSDDNISARAVTLFRNRGDKLVSSFMESATGFGDKKDIGSETEALLETVNQYTKALPDDEAAFAKSQVVNYCLEQEKSGEPVAIKALSNELQQQFDSNQSSFSSASNGSYSPPPKFDNFALENNKEIKNEIIADKNKLRNFMRISGRNEQMSMSFSSSCLGDSVVYDPSTDSLIVKTIPASLKSRLIKLIQDES